MLTDLLMGRFYVHFVRGDPEVAHIDRVVQDTRGNILWLMDGADIYNWNNITHMKKVGD